jgi:hypothetical protein
MQESINALAECRVVRTHDVEIRRSLPIRGPFQGGKEDLVDAQLILVHSSFGSKE